MQSYITKIQVNGIAYVRLGDHVSFRFIPSNVIYHYNTWWIEDSIQESLNQQS